MSGSIGAHVVLSAPLDVARDVRRPRTQVRRRSGFIDLGFKRSRLFDQESRKLGVVGRLSELEKRLRLTREITPTGHSRFSYDLPSQILHAGSGISFREKCRKVNRGQGCCTENVRPRTPGAGAAMQFRNCPGWAGAELCSGPENYGSRASGFFQSRRNDFRAAAFTRGSLSLKKTTPRMAPALPLLGPFLWAVGRP